MTLDEFLKKYNKCPFCRSYMFQTNCRGCKWRFTKIGGEPYKENDLDLFDPTDEWRIRMNKEVTE